MNNVSQRYLAAALSKNQRVITTAEIWSGPTGSSQPSKQELLGDVSIGNWSQDETRSPRWQSTLKIQSRGLDFDDLVPDQPDSLLNPLTGNELRLFHGYGFSDGTQELTECGVYRMTKPAVTDTADSITVSVTGNDRSAEVARRGYTQPYVVTGSPTIDDFVHDFFDAIMPGLTYNLEPSTYTVPDVSFGTQLGTGTVNPMADAITVVTAAGMEVFFDSVGVLTLRTVPDPTTTPVELTFVEGPNCSLTEVDRTLDETQTYNGVICIGNGAGTAAPVQEAVWVTDPTSQLYPATFGYVPYYLVSSLISTSDQAIAAATAMLQTLLTEFDDTAFTSTPNAALAAGDGLVLRRARIGVDNTYCASAIAMSSDPSQLMTVTNRARRTAA